ncbi:MAG TPA: TonB-dependent receptor [Steroidobacteraceae bacterium]|nr:TonB-dependent receptor [Steroidobacteraceae bacterium]HRX88310.1 TonB-dependent receptor [Steroidobacteraceae bacterium]
MNDRFWLQRLGLTGAASLLALLNINVSQAQDSVRSSGQSMTLDEVVVTARRSEEKLLDVPLAISAFSTEQIEQRGIANLDDVAAYTPGLTYSSVIGEFLPAPVIRGVAPIDIFGELNTALFIDGVYVSGREGINFSQLDLERIEVVKGPQSALYGRNAFSGAINYVTAKPTDEFKAKTQVTFGNDGKALASLSVSGPLIPGVLRGRAAVLHDEFDGSYENSWSGPGPGSDIGGYKFKTFQGALVWSPSETFEAEVGIYVSDDRIDNSATNAVAANCEDRRVAAQNLVPPPMSLPSSRVLNFCGELPSIKEDSLSALPAATGEDRDVTRAHLRLLWDIGGGQLSALSGYSNVSQSFFVDGSRNSGETAIFTYQPAPITVVFGFPTSGPTKQFQTGLLQIGGGSSTEEFSQELRFASDREQRLRYSAGATYYKTDEAAGEDGVIATQPLPADFGAFCLACTPFAFGPMYPVVEFAAGVGNAAFLEWFTDPNGGATFTDVFLGKNEAISGFAQAEFDFNDQFTGSIEGRYTDEERSFRRVDTGSNGKDSWGLINWRTSLRYKPTVATTLFAAVAHAEKAGDFDPTTVQFVSNPGVDVTVPGSFDSETILSYEIGVKSELLDRRVSLEFDVYNIDWADIVIPQVVAEVNGQAIITPTGINVNGGDATVRGAEFAINARPLEGVDVNFGVAYLDAKYDNARVQSFTDFPTYSPTGDVSGNKILRTSEWQGNLGAGYRAQLRGDTDWYVRGDLAYRGEQFADASNQTIVPESTNLNASIGLRAERWSLELWGRNLGNEDAPTGAFRDVYFSNTLPTGVSTGGTFFPFRYSVSHPRLRQYGLTWRMRF